MAGAVCVGVAEVEVDTVEDLLELLLTTVLSVDDVLVRVRGRTDDVEVLDLRDDKLLSFEMVDSNVEEVNFELLEVLTDLTVDVEIWGDLTELDVDVFDEVEGFTDVELEVLTVDVPSMYISKRLPAPQYSN
jgi:hypothetical protein